MPIKKRMTSGFKLLPLITGTVGFCVGAFNPATLLAAGMATGGENMITMPVIMGMCGFIVGTPCYVLGAVYTARNERYKHMIIQEALKEFQKIHKK